MTVLSRSKLLYVSLIILVLLARFYSFPRHLRALQSPCASSNSQAVNQYQSEPLPNSLISGDNIEELYDIAIIGGGVGGLTTAGFLKHKVGDLKVILLEKNEKCGGRMQSEFLVGNSNEYRFDVGPSLLLLPDVYRNTFSQLGVDFDDYLKIERVDPLYAVYFSDNSRSEISADINKMRIEVERLGSGSWEAYLQYIKDAEVFLNFGLQNVIEEKLSFEYFASFVWASIRNFPLMSHFSMLNKYFKSSKLRAMMSFQDLYIGLSPYEAPAIFSLLQALEISRGIYYPLGGFTKVAQSLEKVASLHGTEIIQNCSVLSVDFSSVDECRISYLRENKVSNIRAKKVISNIDAPEFEKKFIRSSGNRDRVDSRTLSGRPSCGVVSISFALNSTLEPLAHHTIFFSNQFEKSWKVVESPDEAAFDPEACNFYVHAPSRTDATVCPIGHDAITILVPVPPLTLIQSSSANTSTSKDITRIVRDTVIRRLQRVPGMPLDIESHIVAESYRSPEVWNRDFGLFRGSAFGLAHSIDQLSFLRPRIRHPHIKALYRVGASSRPGNGVPLVMIGARLTAEKVLRDIIKNPSPS